MRRETDANFNVIIIIIIMNSVLSTDCCECQTLFYFRYMSFTIIIIKMIVKSQINNNNDDSYTITIPFSSLSVFIVLYCTVLYLILECVPMTC